MISITDYHYNSTGFNEWIFTSRFIPYTDSVIRYAIYRNDSTGTPWTAGCPCGIAFSDMRCMVAQCVVGCKSCTNLYDCSACDAVSGYFLDPINHYCVTTCPPGQYSITTNNICQLCNIFC